MRFLFAFLLFTLPLQAAELKVGAASSVITPPKGTPLAGYYGYRGMQKVLDDIHSKAIVIQSGETKVALVVCDLISLPRHVVTEARRQIEKATGIPGKNVMISATHTHTGPVIARESSLDELVGANTDLGQRYTELLPGMIAESVSKANEKLAPTIVTAAKGNDEGISFNRRFHMKDGTVGWNPGKLNPKIDRPAGPIDPEIGIVYFDTPKNVGQATYVNFALHADTVGGEGVSADFPGALSKVLGEFRGSDSLTLFGNGTCGNINHINVKWGEPQKGASEAHRIGALLASSVLRTYPTRTPIAADQIRVKIAMVSLELPPISDEDIAKAKQVVENIKSSKSTFLEQVKAFQVLDLVARKGKPLEVEVQVIALGDKLAWVSLPGEIFVEIGLAIKGKSPFQQTMLIELANGSIGYIPNKAAYPQGNYEVISARCAAGSGERLVLTALELLKEVKEEMKSAK
jgi:neutral ceramidase